ncbi:MAG: C4-dicarboxylate TRAP transporter substrate-binding protein [Xanthobacteraceae bacterium]
MSFSYSTIAIAVAGVALFSGDAFAQRKIVYSHTLSSIHPVQTRGLEPYFKTVEKETGGSLKFEIFPGGALANGKAALKSLGTGAFDMGLLADVYSPTDVPVSTSLSDLAVWGEDARIMTGAVNQMLVVDSPELQGDYRKNNIIAFASYSLTPYYFMCNKAEIKTLADVKGKKVRATGSMGALVAGLGGVPVNLTSSEIYEGMQRGQLDCALGPIPWLKTYTLWEVAHTVTDRSLGTYHGTNIINMNIDTWKKLSDKERQAMLVPLPHVVRAMAEGYEADDENVKKEALAKGVKFIKPDASLGGGVDKFRSGEVARVAARAKSRGVKDPEKLQAKFRTAVDKWTKIVREIGDGQWDKAQWDKYEAKLKEEIYDKAKLFDLKS